MVGSTPLIKRSLPQDKVLSHFINISDPPLLSL